MDSRVRAFAETPIANDRVTPAPALPSAARTKAPHSISNFIDRTFKHFNAATLRDASDAYLELLLEGGQMFVSMAGAMSTAEIGLTLAEMIRQKRVHAICCTGANLEEDVFNLVAHEHYERFADYRDLTPQQEQQLMKRHINRVTDTGIPEKAAMTVIEDLAIDAWTKADRQGQRLFPHEVLYDLIRLGKLSKHYETDPAASWVVAAAQADLPLFVPGWEDSTLGNVFTSLCYKKEIRHSTTIKGGIDYMLALAEWYRRASAKHDVGFFQIGGGIAGDFSICVVPLLQQDVGEKKTPLWSYFCQISDSTTSYGSYSGAVPNEKITWGKIGPKTPAFVIESDATIVVPLMFAKILGW